MIPIFMSNAPTSWDVPTFYPPSAISTRFGGQSAHDATVPSLAPAAYACGFSKAQPFAYNVDKPE
jgi:hypothetical protein